jgi:apolipoprotein N-acyltransferase
MNKALHVLQRWDPRIGLLMAGAALGGFSYLCLVGVLPSWGGLLALLVVCWMGQKIAKNHIRLWVWLGYWFSLNGWVGFALLGLYNLPGVYVAALAVLIVLYTLGFVAISWVFSGKPKGFWPLQVLGFAAGLTGLDWLLSNPAWMHNYAVPLSHGYYLFTPEIAPLYHHLGMYGACFVLYALLALVVKKRGIALLGLLGVVALLPMPISSKTMPINLIQPGIIGKGAGFNQRLAAFMQDIDQYLDGVLNILPESSLHHYNPEADPLHLRQKSVLVGGVVRSEGLFYNAALLQDQQYYKKYLVPLEEDSWIQPGSSLQTPIVIWQNYKLGIAICYESTYPFQNKNIDALVVLSNTQGQQAAAIHLRSVQVRSAELGKAAVFVSMGGGSALLDKGTIRKKLPWGELGVEQLELPVF